MFKKFLTTIVAIGASLSQASEVNASFPWSEYTVLSTSFGSTFNQLSGTPARINLPGETLPGPDGRLVVQFPFMTEMVVSVGPQSIQRGCQLVSNDPSFTGIIATTPVTHATKFIAPPVRDTRPGRTTWWMYKFSINGGLGAQVRSIQTTFYQIQGGIAQCAYEILYKGPQAYILPVFNEKMVAVHKDGPVKPKEELAVPFGAAAMAAPAEPKEIKPVQNNLTEKFDLKVDAK